MVLGRLDPDNFLGGTMKLDAEAARRGIKDKIADPLKLDVIAAAQAIVDISINKMSLAVREVSVAKGYDPRDFALVASGGAGPLHVCAIARELYIPTVIVPLFPSHFSALGMLLADERHDFTRTVYSDLASVDFAKLVAVHDEMVQGRQGQPAPRQERELPDPSRSALHGPGVHACRCRSRSTSSGRASARPSAPRSTSFTSCATRTIRRTSRSRWSTSGSAPSASGRSSASRASHRADAPRRPASAPAYFTSASKPLTAKVYRREDLGAGAQIAGPALIQEHGTTTVLFENDQCRVADSGELIITIGAVR